MTNNRNENRDDLDQGSAGYDQGSADTGQKGGQAQQSESEMNYDDMGSEGIGGSYGETDDKDEPLSGM